MNHPVATREGYVLRIRRPSGLEEVLGLGREPITIGRAETNTLVLNDGSVSRNHARIDCGQNRYMLTDCGSKNGTLVNGRPIQAHVLQEGDVVRVGGTELAFEPALAEIRVDTQTVGFPVVEAGVPDPGRPAPGGPTGLEALAHISDLLAAAKGELTALEEVALHLRSVVACDRATIVLVEEGTLNPLMQFTHSALQQGSDEGPGDQVIRAGLTSERPVCLNVPKASSVLNATLGVRNHVLLVPLLGDDRKLGLLVMERQPSRSTFDQADLQLASIAGSHLATFLRFVA